MEGGTLEVNESELLELVAPGPFHFESGGGVFIKFARSYEISPVSVRNTFLEARGSCYLLSNSIHINRPSLGQLHFRSLYLASDMINLHADNPHPQP